MRDLAASLLRNVKNIQGWRTKRRLVVIESDDWGSIRMPSKSVYDRFVKRGISVDQTQYNRYDALESNDDLTALYEVLNRYHDQSGRPPCFTANMIVANPDFEKIRQSNFEKYYYETFEDTLRKYPQHDLVFSLYHEGIKAGYFRPQFHGREHVQINRWLKALQRPNENILFAFNEGTTYSGKDDYNFMESFDWDEPDEVQGQRNIILDGLQLFKKAFTYNSDTFIAPCYTWDPILEQALLQGGVCCIQGSSTQYMPAGGFNNYVIKKHVLGESKHGLTYLTRNCVFEPSLIPKSNWVDYTLTNIRDAFRWNKPAVICTHRINFIGYLDETNRAKNLKMLDTILQQILRKWPDVEFVSSDELGAIIQKDQSNLNVKIN